LVAAKLWNLLLRITQYKMTKEVNIVGGADLAAFLKLLPKKLETNIMRAALRAGASVIAKEAKNNLSVHKTGSLKKSIRTSSRSQKGTVFAYARAGGNRGAGNKDKSAFYSAFIEYGSAAHGIVAKNKPNLVFRARDGRLVKTKFIPLHPGFSAKPFMRPAFDTKGAEAVAAVAKKIRERLSQEGINVPLGEGTENVG
jgi:HK97 gp10 family phage protein